MKQPKKSPQRLLKLLLMALVVVAMTACGSPATLPGSTPNAEPTETEVSPVPTEAGPTETTVSPLPTGVLPTPTPRVSSEATPQPQPTQPTQTQIEIQAATVFTEDFEAPFIRKRTEDTPAGVLTTAQSDPDHTSPTNGFVWYEDENYYFKTPSYFKCGEVAPGFADILSGCVTDQFDENGRPEFVVACQPGRCANDDPSRIYEGDQAAQYFWFLRTGFGGYYFPVNVPQGAQACELSAQFQGTYFNTPQSTDEYLTIMPSLQVRTAPPLRDGVDIAGEQFVNLPFEGNKWYDQYHELAIEFDAVPGEQFVILGARSNFPSNTNIYWDDVTLECDVAVEVVVEQPQPTQPPVVNTPAPTAPPVGPEPGIPSGAPVALGLLSQLDLVVDSFASSPLYSDVRDMDCRAFNDNSDASVNIRTAIGANGEFLAPSTGNQPVGSLFGNEEIGVLMIYDAPDNQARWALVYKVEAGIEVGGWSAQFINFPAGTERYAWLNCEQWDWQSE